MSVADKITRLKTARDNIRTALAGYDIDASDHGYEDFADDIEGITVFDPDDYAVVIYKENNEYKRRYEYIGKTVTTLASNHFDGKNNIVSVILPSTITSLGEYCFRNCSNLRSINFENITELGNYSLAECSSLLELDCPNVVNIAIKAFNQGFTSIPFSLKKVVLPKIKTVPGNCFRNQNNNSFAELRYVDISSATDISGSAFQGCWNLTTVKLGSEVKTIGGSAFGYTAVSGELDFPELESIGADSFINTNITKVKNLGSITTLPPAFIGCSKLTFLRIPDTVTSLGHTIVQGTHDSDVTVICEPITPPTYGWGALGDATVVYVPDESVDAYKAASGWSAIASKIHPLSEYTGTD